MHRNLFFKIYKFTLKRQKFINQFSSYNVIPNMRFIHIEVPDLEQQQTINLDNFEEMYPTLKLPYKLQHPEHVKRSKDFVRLRLEKYPNGLNQIQLSDYVEIYQDVVDKQEQKKVRNDIEIVLMYYNRILSKSVFCPESIPLAGIQI